MSATEPQNMDRVVIDRLTNNEIIELIVATNNQNLKRKLLRWAQITGINCCDLVIVRPADNDPNKKVSQ